MVANSHNYGSYSKGAFNKGGVYDWAVQRKTAVILAAYFIFLAYFFYNNNQLEYNSWVELFQPVLFKAFTIIFLICLIRHAWVGLWVIATDYISYLKFRAVFLGVCKTSLIGYLVWGIYILFLI
ncbi:MAG: succinate dehydrogenase, hydrophobic membrane anchor protein [Gammaproteobacteria bacterium]|nr:succinate dehydrogenase, hydrophobic membrane anchor protein [Gammaproteobacteria bacterium]